MGSVVLEVVIECVVSIGGFMIQVLYNMFGIRVLFKKEKGVLLKDRNL